ncbi:MAG: alpha/beta fold hydrolase [Labilithrix sp.]|nr:alpha/beta fold hydrolase [Labilithrix sp.]
MLRPAWLPVVVPLFLVACSSAEERRDPRSPEPAAPAEPAPEPGPTSTTGLVPTACRFAVPKSAEGSAYRCADLVVPENRANAAARTIKVHVIIFKGKEGGVPTIELNGGPGGSSEMLAQSLSVRAGFTKDNYLRLLDIGDLILVDQRGTGRSLPRLDCGQTEEPSACRQRHEKAGVDLTGYVTSEAADDVHDLRVALGVPKVSLHGISYGTRVALEILRRHPDDVAATVIDGVLPAQVGLLGGWSKNIEHVVSHVFAACAADAKCNGAFPNLDASLASLKAKLDAAPFDSSYYGKYDWYAFRDDLLNRLYGEGEAGRLPHRVHDLLTATQAKFAAEEKADEDTWMAESARMDGELFGGPLGAELAARVDADTDPDASGMAHGMYLSVTCSDHGQYESLDAALAAEAKVRPELRDPDALRFEFSMCDAWPKRPKSPDGLSAVTSSKSVLVLGGEVDPATPLAWAELAAKTLSNGQLVPIKGGAHGVVDACGFDMKTAFLRTSAPVDTSCAATRSLAFFYPDPGAPAFAPRAKVSSPAVSRVVPSIALERLRGGRRLHPSR